jgi:alkylation response protein AidB-like acyl-CoA dehydrogenase
MIQSTGKIYMDTSGYQQAIVKDAAEFTNTNIRPFAAEFDSKEALPKKLIQDMASNGYLAASFPKAYGGLALDPVHYGLFTEEFGKGCCSARGLITVHTSLVGESILRWGTEAQKKTWLPAMAAGEKIAAFALTEPEVGTDAQSIQTHYTKNGDAYIINGTKKWITCGDIADVFMVIATNGKAVSAFMVERKFAGVSSKPIRGLLASRASHIAELTFENVEVPAENLIGTEGGGFTYIVNTALDHGRYSIAWAGVAIAQEALDAMVKYARNRSQFGKKLHNFQLIQGMIGDATTKIHAARALCLKAGEMRKNNHDDAIIETSIAKYFSSKIAMQVTIDAVQIHGGNGFSSDYPVERLFREAKVLEIIEGTSQIQQEIISKYALLRYYVK